MSRVSVQVSLPYSHHDSTIDDDKLQNHSKNLEKIGCSRMKGLKSCGPVLSMKSQSLAGLFVSCGVTKFGSNKLILLKFFHSALLQQVIKLRQKLGVRRLILITILMILSSQIMQLQLSLICSSPRNEVPKHRRN